MRHAFALYQGILVDSQDPDLSYQSFLDQGLICPVCREPVYFRAGAKKTSCKGKEFTTRAMFSHYAGDPLSCELRAKTPEYERLIGVMSAESRGQRLKLFQSRLWDVIRAGEWQGPEFNTIPADPLSVIPPRLRSPAQRMVKAFKSAFRHRESVDIAREYAQQVLARVFDGSYSEKIEPGERDYCKLLSSNCDRATQELITLEVVSFLFTEPADPLLEKLGYTAFFVAAASGELDKGKSPIAIILKAGISTLVSVNWERGIRLVRDQPEEFRRIFGRSCLAGVGFGRK